jgi:glutamate-5-semialdehyde dehydrogenase
MTDKNYILNICEKAKEASRFCARLSTNEKNELLKKIAKELRAETNYIIDENRKDLQSADEIRLSSAFIDRLMLNQSRIGVLAASIDEIASFDDPIGNIENLVQRPSGIRVGQMRVPLGVVAVIFESRPNVTTDIAALCIKSGNASILRGGKESIHSNIALYNIVKKAISDAGYPEGIVTLIDKTERELVQELLKMDSYVDIVIPRGGESLIKMVCEMSSIPVIKHDKGVCHTFVDETADKEMASVICINAKVQKPSACNAMETLLIHENFSDIKGLLGDLIDKKVELRGCDRTCILMKDKVKKATELDWDTEYLDLILSVKIVSSLDEAIAHIMRYSSDHSETIVTENYSNSERFIKEVDSAAVFVNSSTRFHDGGEFGLGAEVGISTQKLHARGAMGLKGLTTLKYVVYGNGEVRK